MNGSDETYEGTVMSWDYPYYGFDPIPAIRYKIYTIRLNDRRIFRVSETKLLDLSQGDKCLVVFPRGNASQAYVSEPRTGSTSTTPNEDRLEIYKMTI